MDEWDKLKTPPMTNDELASSGADLLVRVERLEDLLWKCGQVIDEEFIFIKTMLFQLKMDDIQFTMKTPKKKLMELEDSFKGFLKYYYSNTSINNISNICGGEKVTGFVIEPDEDKIETIT
jgi:hypothetical protein